MPRRLTHLPWTQQPQGVVSPAYVFGRRPLFLVNAATGPMDLVTGQYPRAGGPIPIGSGSLGAAFVYGGELGYAYPLTLQSRNAPAVTVFVLIEPSASAGGNAGRVLLRSMGSATNSFAVGIHRGSQDGPLFLVNGTSSDVTASPSANIGDANTAAIRLLTLTIEGGNYAGYVDGEQVISGSGIGDIDYSRSDLDIYLLTNSQGSSASTFRGNVYFAGIIEGALSYDEARAFRGYEAFEPQRVWVPVASAGGGGGFQAAWAANANTVIQGPRV